MNRVFRALLLLTLTTAAPLRAQLEECDLVRSEYAEQADLGGGNTMVRIEGPMAIRCAGGARVSADQAVFYQPRNERRFTGNVVYEDSAQTITADLLTSFGQENRILARGNVFYTDLSTGSTIRGMEMERFTPAIPGGEERTVVRGRPHAIFHRERSTEPDTAAPLVMDADSMIIRGERSFVGSGRVQFERGELSGEGEQVAMDDEAGTLDILGSAVVGRRGPPRPARLQTERFSLTAERVHGELEDEEIRQLTATGDALLDGRTARVDAPLLHLFFEDSQLNRLVATVTEPPADDIVAAAEVEPEAAERRVRPGRLPLPTEGLPRRELPEAARPRPPVEAAPQAAAATPSRVLATAEGLRIVSDSLEILAPGEVVEQLTAVGDALGERLPKDTAAAPPDRPLILATEWIRGDTIIGWFAEGPPPAPGDTARRVLERLVSVGVSRPASSLHLLAGEEGVDGPNVNYLKEASRITIHLEGGEVVDVSTEGPVVGIYLTRQRRQPAATPSEPPPPGGSPGRADGAR